MEWTAWVQAVKDLGFPVIVALYLLIRLDILIRNNTDALNKLVMAITRLMSGRRDDDGV